MLFKELSVYSLIGQREGNSKFDATQQPSSFLSPLAMVRQILQGLPFLGPDPWLLLHVDLPG